MANLQPPTQDVCVIACLQAEAWERCNDIGNYFRFGDNNPDLLHSILYPPYKADYKSQEREKRKSKAETVRRTKIRNTTVRYGTHTTPHSSQGEFR